MQEKESIRIQSEAVVPDVVKKGKHSKLRSWITPIFGRMPLKDALSGFIGSGGDLGSYS